MWFNTLHIETSEAHLYYTMIEPTADQSLRISIARQLMRSKCGWLRSQAYWFLNARGLTGMTIKFL